MLDTIAYILLGLILLFVPGFLFSLALFPRKDSFDFWERVGVSLALSVLVLIYVGFILAQPGLGMLTLAPFLGVVAVVCLLFTLVAFLRGGLEVIAIYRRALMQKLGKLRPPKPKPAPVEERPAPP